MSFFRLEKKNLVALVEDLPEESREKAKEI